MKHALRNMLSFAGVLLIIASLVWISFHQEKQQVIRTQSTANRPTAPKPFAVVVLDPGHGGQDSGAMCGGVMEKDLTLDVARRVDRLLDAEGVATLMTRLGDTYVSLADRAAFGNRVRDSIFVSIHFNEDNKPVASGVEGGFLTNKEDVSKLASEDYRDQLAAAVADGILRYRDAVSQRKSALTATGLETAE